MLDHGARALRRLDQSDPGTRLSRTYCTILIKAAHPSTPGALRALNYFDNGVTLKDCVIFEHEKLTDFGTVVARTENQRSPRGTPDYTAPEKLAGLFG